MHTLELRKTGFYPPKGKKYSNQGPTGDWCLGSFYDVELSLTYDSAWEKGNAYGVNFKTVRAKNAGLFPLFSPVLQILTETSFNWLRCTTTLWNIWFTDIHCNLNFISFKERAMYKICWTWTANQSQSGLRRSLYVHQGRQVFAYTKIHWFVYCKRVNCMVVNYISVKLW